RLGGLIGSKLNSLTINHHSNPDTAAQIRDLPTQFAILRLQGVHQFFLLKEHLSYAFKTSTSSPIHHGFLLQITCTQLFYKIISRHRPTPPDESRTMPDTA